MQTDHIDLYQMHHVDRDTPWDEIWQAMDVLVTAGQGALRRQQQLRRLAHRAGERGRAPARHSLGLVSEQSLYNLTARTIELEVLPACEHYGVGMIPWSPLGGGLLGGVLADRAAGGRRGNAGLQSRVETMRPQLERWEKLCAELGHAPADVALAWLLHQPIVTAPIIGPRTLDQLDTAMGALDVQLERRRPRPARRDLPRPRRSRAGGLRLVRSTR